MSILELGNSEAEILGTIFGFICCTLHTLALCDSASFEGLPTSSKTLIRSSQLEIYIK